MAKQALVQQTADMLIDSYVERLVLRVEVKTLRSVPTHYGYITDAWNYFDKVDFINRAEWDFLKVLTKIEDDQILVKHIYNNRRFRSDVRSKYEFMSMKIVLSDNGFGSFCKIEATDRTVN